MIENSKSQLAKLMATENITVEQRKVSTAYFDLKNRILVTPIFKNEISTDLLDLFLSHEVSHALHTPMDGWHNSIKNLGVRKSILNVCEDARIEKKIKRKFPGLKTSYIAGYKEIINMDLFGLKTMGIEPNEMNLIDRINLETKCGIFFDLAFNDEEKVLLRDVQDAETFEEVIIVAQKIQQYMKDHPQEDEFEMDDFGDLFGDEDEPIEMTQEEFDELEDIEEGIQSNRSRKVIITNPRKDDTEKELTNGSQASNNGDENLDSQTDISFRNREKELYGTTECDYVNVPNPILENIIVPYKTILRRFKGERDFDSHLMVDYNTFRKSSGKSVGYLVKEFELRKNAAQMSKAKISKTGDLDTTKLYGYRFTEDIFKRITVVPNGKSHGLIMVVDWSGSMCNTIHETIKQCLVLAYFCKKVNIPFEVYAFTSQYFDESHTRKEFSKYNNGDLVVRGNFHLMNILSSNMTASEFRDASMMLFSYYKREYSPNGSPNWMALGGTPLNEAIIACMKIIPQYREERKLDIVNLVILSDGEGAPIREIKTNTGTTHAGRNNWVLRDPITKNQHTFKWDKAQQQTVGFLHLLKMIVKCNVIGFYIMRRSSFRSVYQDYKGATEKEIIEKYGREFSKRGCFAIENVGYDDYYFIYDKKLDIEDFDFESVDVTSKTTKGLAKEFITYSQGKLNNKYILNKFIGRIV